MERFGFLRADKKIDIVKSFMKNRFGIWGKTRKTLPLTPHPEPLPQGERGNNF
jgi:hypothetical protein